MNLPLREDQTKSTNKKHLIQFWMESTTLESTATLKNSLVWIYQLKIWLSKTLMNSKKKLFETNDVFNYKILVYNLIYIYNDR